MRRSVLGGLALCLTLTLTGCGDDVSVADRPSSSPSTAGTSPADTGKSPGSPTVSTSPTTTPSVAEGASGDTYASYTPTTGVELPGETVAVNGPTEWGNDPLIGGLGASLSDPDDPQFNVTLGDTASSGEESLDDQASGTIEVNQWDDSVERLDDVVVAGNPAYHVAGRDTQFLNYIDEIGFKLDGRQIRVRISTTRGYDPAQREQLIGSVMASFRVTA